MVLKKIAAILLLAFTFFLLFTTGLTCSGMAWAKAPENASRVQVSPRTTLLPQTHFIMVVGEEPTTADVNACRFAARLVADAGYPVGSYCQHAAAPQSPSLPRPGDPVLFFYFGEGFSEEWVRENVPVEQAAGGSVALFPTLVSGDSSLASDEGSTFTAVFALKGGNSGELAKIAVRCLYEQTDSGLSFKEATACWARLHAEESSEGTRIEGGWDDHLRGPLIYPPRGVVSDWDRAAARALLAYDKRVAERVNAPVAEGGSPLENWGVAKHTLVWSGAGVGIGCGIASAVTYSKGVSLNQDIGNGVYGFVGDKSLEVAVGEYNALGKRLPLLLGCAGAGAAATTVGILLPTNNKNPTVAVSPTGITVMGRF